MTAVALSQFMIGFIYIYFQVYSLRKRWYFKELTAADGYYLFLKSGNFNPIGLKIFALITFAFKIQRADSKYYFS